MKCYAAIPPNYVQKILYEKSYKIITQISASAQVIPYEIFEKYSKVANVYNMWRTVSIHVFISKLIENNLFKEFYFDIRHQLKP